MKAFVHISGDQPGLIGWGCFDVMLDGIKAGLDRLPHLDREEVFSEWCYELYIEEFNQILLSINSHLLEKALITESFAIFWNTEILPLVEIDPRYQGVCTPVR
ncbi:hypothetical protein [Deinococcus hopiensis]|uniref:Uncharacterized protein n=1 Tax=Deinococcus hopiensis KR-140 TaxID=695939 RepID=A0A1W1UJ74_9DEIO|nr:hypothetical protein [Deinococcus hopiensis]SMB81168.1 hypothetical protein SAMN00790413_04488 [Deinococcus hopiensis KR-140]